MQSNQEMAEPGTPEPGALERLTLCLGSWQGGQSGMSWGTLVWLRFPRACPSSLTLFIKSGSLMEQAFHFSRKEGCAGSSQTKENHL